MKHDSDPTRGNFYSRTGCRLIPQIDRETIYRYIRNGKLIASKLGRAYRIPKRSIDLLLWVTRARPDISLPGSTPV